MEWRACGRASEATTLTAVLHRCQAGRAWPVSASRPHGTQHDSPRGRLCSCSGSIHPPRRVCREAVSSSWWRRARGRASEATTLTAVLHRCQAGRAWPMSASRPHGTQHDSPRCHLCSCSGSIHPPRRVHREAVCSSLERRAGRGASEAATLTAVLHRCQAGRAWPMSASRPHGTQHDSPRCHLCSCSGGIEPSPDAASRSREQQLAEACSSTRG